MNNFGRVMETDTRMPVFIRSGSSRKTQLSYLELQRRCRSLLALHSHDIETSAAAAQTSLSAQLPNRIRDMRDRIIIFRHP